MALVFAILLTNAAFAQNIPPTAPAEGTKQTASAPPRISSMPADPAAILDVGSMVNGLNRNQTSPWHIKATYQAFDTNGKLSNTGSYEEFRFSDKSYKRTYTSAKFTQTEYATERGIFRSGSQDWPGYQETKVQMYLTVPIPAQLGLSNPQLKKENLAVGTERLQCVGMKSTQSFVIESAYCFEQDRPMLRLMLSGDGLTQTVFNSVVEFHGHFISRDVLVTYRNKPTLTIHVDEINSLSTSGSTEFTPPSDAAGPIAGKLIIPEGTMSPLILVQVFPVYPVVAKDTHVEGTVILHLTVGKDGAVKSAEATSGPNPLRTAAADAVRHWMYRPFMFLGDPTEIETDVKIIFTVSNVSPVYPR